MISAKQAKKVTTDFQSLPLSLSLLQVVQELGFEHLSPIQAQSIPHLLEGKDLVGQSKTGSGKTAAFSIPILEKVNLRERRIQSLILCPTRELCTQVAREIRKLGRRHSGLQVLILSGGQPLHPQLRALEKGVHIVVGTPGRIIDHLLRKSLTFEEVSYVVLDEADRMLDMGFQEDMEKILGSTPKTRQTVFFSATYPRSIETMSRAFQKNPVRITIEDDKPAAASIRQQVYEVESESKFNALIWLLQQQKPESAIVFCNLKSTVVELKQALSRSGVSAGGLQGDLEQSERDRIMAKFRNKSIRVLVATDVAARGIDVENLDIVFNFDLPIKPEIYVHRIGRTGRAGKKGLAIALATPREKSKVEGIEKFTGIPIERKSVPSLTHLDRDPEKKVIQQEAQMETLFISAGRKEKMRPGDILGALTGDAGRLNGSDIGKIEIHDHFSYVAVAKSVAEVALKRLRDGRIKGKKFRIEKVR